MARVRAEAEAAEAAAAEAQARDAAVAAAAAEATANARVVSANVAAEAAAAIAVAAEEIAAEADDAETYKAAALIESIAEDEAASAVQDEVTAVTEASSAAEARALAQQLVEEAAAELELAVAEAAAAAAAHELATAEAEAAKASAAARAHAEAAAAAEAAAKAEAETEAEAEAEWAAAPKRSPETEKVAIRVVSSDSAEAIDLLPPQGREPFVSFVPGHSRLLASMHTHDELTGAHPDSNYERVVLKGTLSQRHARALQLLDDARADVRSLAGELMHLKARELSRAKLLRMGLTPADIESSIYGPAMRNDGSLLTVEALMVQEIEDWRAKIEADVAAMKASFEARKKRLSSANARLRKELHRAQRSAELTAREPSPSAALYSARDKLRANAITIQALRAKLDAGRAQYESLTLEAAELHARERERSAAWINKERQLRLEFETSERGIKLLTRLKTYSQTISDLREKLAAERAKVESAEARTAEVEAERDAKQAELGRVQAEAEAAAAAAEAAEARLHNDVANARAEMSDTSKQLARAHATIKALEGSFEEAATKFARQEGQLREVHAAETASLLAKYEKTKEILKGKVAKAKLVASSQQQRAETAEAKVAKLSRKLQATHVQMSQELESSRVERETVEEAAQARELELLEQLNELRHSQALTHSTSLDQLRDLEVSIQETQRKANHRVAFLEQELEKAAATAEASKVATAAAERRAEMAEAQRAALEKALKDEKVKLAEEIRLTGELQDQVASLEQERLALKRNIMAAETADMGQDEKDAIMEVVHKNEHIKSLEDVVASQRAELNLASVEKQALEVELSAARQTLKRYEELGLDRPSGRRHKSPEVSQAPEAVAMAALEPAAAEAAPAAAPKSETIQFEMSSDDDDGDGDGFAAQALKSVGLAAMAEESGSSGGGGYNPIASLGGRDAYALTSSDGELDLPGT
ncbi:uncharacterized protein AMSG_04920 [Thecamonas trahens ATCC 50062]|uniref:Uncharacterized protein n=1 Tax=Thecamonas trahens ATCC 50062 TaxID=461836 RepID=A0A0L0D7W1_THETB|nr:hypothetical protein AMSG_04920 [Thecamonas trahens ATCC 50062]KNC48472.1 hypothetical protein AMSG_04920 [Thecamonas trahens ATCC 50062]|eukprot:XP_013758584.1 hypothetical protein AMSG_04920 [Thecamonas trahens ATCC 50062]